jgi:hypothetical protein
MLLIIGVAVARSASHGIAADLDSLPVRIEGLSVLRGEVVFGADHEWFESTEIDASFFLTSDPWQAWGVGTDEKTRYVAAKPDGTIFLSESADRAANWAYVRMYNGVSAWKTHIIHNECTIQWQKTMPEKEFRFVSLVPSNDARIVKDKDGIERKVYPATLVRGDRRKYKVTRLTPSPEYSAGYDANDHFGLGQLCVVNGDVYFSVGPLPPGRFDPERTFDLWHLDRQLVTVRMQKKWWFLTTDEKGFARLEDKPTMQSLWEVPRPKRESREGLIVQEQDDGTGLCLAPDDESVTLRDLNGNDVQFRRAKLSKEPHKLRIGRIAP